MKYFKIKYKDGTSKIVKADNSLTVIKIWTLKSSVISICRMIKKLSYFHGFRAIYPDKKTKPNGYFVEYFVK